MNILKIQNEFVPPLIPTDMTHTLGENIDPIKRFYQRKRILFSNSKYVQFIIVKRINEENFLVRITQCVSLAAVFQCTC